MALYVWLYLNFEIKHKQVISQINWAKWIYNFRKKITTNHRKNGV